MTDLRNLRIRKIGTSKGIIIPAGILKELKLDVGDSIDIVGLKKSGVIREGWSEIFRNYATELEDEKKIKSPGVTSVTYKIHYTKNGGNLKWKLLVIPVRIIDDKSSIKEFVKNEFIKVMEGTKNLEITKIELYRIHYGDDR